jgi:hypothetical protein
MKGGMIWEEEDLLSFNNDTHKRLQAPIAEDKHRLLQVPDRRWKRNQWFRST